MLNRRNTRHAHRVFRHLMEPVTFKARNAAAATVTYTSYSVTARKAPDEVTAQPAPSGPLTNTTWLLFRRELELAGAPEPRAGDIIVQSENSSVWEIETVGRKLFENTFECQCVSRPA